MEYWFWTFLFFSFLGYLLECCFAKLTGARRKNRKCFLLLPLCPVYGLGMLAALSLPESWTENFFWQAFWGGVVCTAVEFWTHWLYEKVFGVYFWDYRPTKMDIDGRICLPFSIAWGLLSALAVRVIFPAWQPICAVIPSGVTLALALLFLIDCVCSAHLLWNFHDIELLQVKSLRSKFFHGNSGEMR